MRHLLYFLAPISTFNLSHDASFLATCNAFLLLGDVKLANASFHHGLLIYFLSYQTFVTNLHLLRVELRRKLQEKLDRVTEPLEFSATLIRPSKQLRKWLIYGIETSSCINYCIYTTLSMHTNKPETFPWCSRQLA